jgi:carbonic anhydrase
MTTYQSPIDLSTGMVDLYSSTINARVPRKKFAYVFSDADPTLLKFLIVGQGNKFEVNGTTFRQTEFHFHIPAEHTINCKSFCLEAHFVFKTPSLLDVAVPGILFHFAHRSDKFIREVVQHLQEGTTRIPEFHSYFTYAGSLTSAPFPNPQQVNWLVKKHSLPVTRKDFETLKAYSQIARPIQDRAGRDVILAECC